MASYSDSRSVHKTLSGTTADVVTISFKWDNLVVSNRTGAGYLWVKEGANTALAAEDNGTQFVPPGEELVIDRPGDGVVTVVGNGNGYSVYGETPEDGS